MERVFQDFHGLAGFLIVIVELDVKARLYLTKAQGESTAFI
ncbi:MAG: hypothetical protein ACTSUE_06605 [Promethearchaeota archaeon]